MEFVEIPLWGIFWVGLLLIAGLLFLLWIPFKLHLNGKWVDSKWEGEWTLEYLFWTLHQSTPGQPDISSSPQTNQDLDETIASEAKEFERGALDAKYHESTIQDQKSPPISPPVIPESSSSKRSSSSSQTLIRDTDLDEVTNKPSKNGFKFRINAWMKSQKNRWIVLWKEKGFPFLKKWTLECLKSFQLWQKLIRYSVFCFWKAKILFKVKIDTLRVEWGEKRPGNLAEWLPLTYSVLSVLPQNTGFCLDIDWRPQKRRNFWIRAVVEHRPIMFLHWLNLCLIHFPLWTCITVGRKSYEKVMKPAKPLT